MQMNKFTYSHKVNLTMNENNQMCLIYKVHVHHRITIKWNLPKYVRFLFDFWLCSRSSLTFSSENEDNISTHSVVGNQINKSKDELQFFVLTIYMP